MGHHTGAKIPHYWAYARTFVLNDHMFEPVKSWSLHLYLLSGWSARCRNRSPMSCASEVMGPYSVSQFGNAMRQEVMEGRTDRRLARHAE